MQKEDIQVLYFEDDGRIPNNPNLPFVKTLFSHIPLRSLPVNSIV
jgi:uncharacterized protein YjlB